MIVELLQQRVAELKATGLSIVLAEQNLQFVMALADRVYILEKGEVRFTGTPADLQGRRAHRAPVPDGVTDKRKAAAFAGGGPMVVARAHSVRNVP